MKRTARSWWIVHALSVVAIAAPLAWISHALRRMEGAEIEARMESERQGRLRLALWRMDSWLLPLLAREAARPYFEYLSYYPQGRNDTHVLNEINPGEVLLPSPLMTARYETIRLHFQFGRDGALAAPQLPEGKLLDLALSTRLPAGGLTARRESLARVAALVDLEPVFRRVCELEEKESRGGGQSRAGMPSLVVSGPELARRQRLMQNQMVLQARS